MVTGKMKERGKYLSMPILFFFALSLFLSGTALADSNDTLTYGVGGGLIGALAGSIGGYAGAGALIGGGVGLAAGAMSDSSKNSAQQKQQQQMQDAYEKGVRDGSSVHYSEGPDRSHIDSFGDKLKD
jgi:hypothetical protein